MKKDNLDQLFEDIREDFDIEVPRIGHQDRFLSKLNESTSTSKTNDSKSYPFWKPLLAIAAIMVMCIALFNVLYQQPTTTGLASVSPEMSKTQDFFTSTIANELNQLQKKERTPETKILIDDALEQLKILEANYESLKNDLTESGDDKRVIYAMISNFQNRIDVLQSVMERIDSVKQLKQTTL